MLVYTDNKLLLLRPWPTRLGCFTPFRSLRGDAQYATPSSSLRETAHTLPCGWAGVFNEKMCNVASYYCVSSCVSFFACVFFLRVSLNRLLQEQHVVFLNNLVLMRHILLRAMIVAVAICQVLF